ncbi:hypothetical protein FHS10_004295 [Mucilaginibacter dorajii]|nr:hypothetical protein [Mucilaginibacter dorajii]
MGLNLFYIETQYFASPAIQGGFANAIYIFDLNNLTCKYDLHAGDAKYCVSTKEFKKHL